MKSIYNSKSIEIVNFLTFDLLKLEDLIFFAKTKSESKVSLFLYSLEVVFCPLFSFLALSLAFF